MDNRCSKNQNESVSIPWTFWTVIDLLVDLKDEGSVYSFDNGIDKIIRAEPILESFDLGLKNVGCPP